MTPQETRMLRALVAIAWADRRLAKEESSMLAQLFAAFDATEAETKALKEYAMKARTLSDVPLADLSAEERELLLANAAVLTLADGKRSPEEKKALDDLANLLGIDASKRDAIVADAKDGAFCLPSRQLADA